MVNANNGNGAGRVWSRALGIIGLVTTAAIAVIGWTLIVRKEGADAALLAATRIVAVETRQVTVMEQLSKMDNRLNKVDLVAERLVKIDDRLDRLERLLQARPGERGREP